jgi:hypothetical protein
MGFHAVRQAPLWLAAGTQMKVTFFWRHNTQVALGQISETRIAITLVETLAGFASAMNTFNLL